MKRKMALLMAAVMLLTTPASVALANDDLEMIVVEEEANEAALIAEEEIDDTEVETEEKEIAAVESKTEGEFVVSVEEVEDPSDEEGLVSSSDSDGSVYTFNGHSYQVFSSASSYDEAEEICESYGGHLATITSEEENAFLYNMINECGYSSAYFGLFRESDTWKWVTGEEFTYSNWASGEPNDSGGDECYGMFYYMYDTGCWNDGSWGVELTEFICEWEETQTNDEFTVTVFAADYSDYYVYDGTAIEPLVTVTYGSITLIKGTDYKISYSNNVNAGEGKIVVTGIGDYSGTKITKYFTINKAEQNLYVEIGTSSIKAGNTISITTRAEGNITYFSSDTSVATVSSKGVIKGISSGTATIHILAAATKNYEMAEKTLTINVTAGAAKISSLTNTSKGITIKWSSVDNVTKYYIYRKTATGSYKRIKTVNRSNNKDLIGYSYTDKTAKNGTQYTYMIKTYDGSTKSNSATASIYRLEGTSLSSVKSKSSGTMTVKWSKDKTVSGYEIQYSTSRLNLSSGTTQKISGATTKTTTIYNLTKGKKYYVRIRTYIGDSYSAWSSVKSVKISK